MSDGMAESCAIIAFHVNGGNPRTGETRGFRRAGRLLRTDRVEFDGGAEAFAGIAVTHDNLKVGAGFGERLQGIGERSGAVFEFFPPQGDLFDFDWHGESSDQQHPCFRFGWYSGEGVYSMPGGSLWVGHSATGFGRSW